MFFFSRFDSVTEQKKGIRLLFNTQCCGLSIPIGQNVSIHFRYRFYSNRHPRGLRIPNSFCKRPVAFTSKYNRIKRKYTSGKIFNPLVLRISHERLLYCITFHWFYVTMMSLYFISLVYINRFQRNCFYCSSEKYL